MNVKELQALIRLLRKEGVKHYRTPELSLELGEQPKVVKRAGNQTDKIETPDEFSEEQTLFWSSGGIPDEKISD